MSNCIVSGTILNDVQNGRILWSCGATFPQNVEELDSQISFSRSALAGRPGLAGRVLAGWGWPAWAGWVVVRFGRLAGWFVGLSAGYLVCGLACSSKAVEHVSCG